MSEQFKTPPTPPEVNRATEAILGWMTRNGAPVFTQTGRSNRGHAVVVLAMIDTPEIVGRVLKAIDEATRAEGMTCGGFVGPTRVEVPAGPPTTDEGPLTKDQ